MTLTAKVGILMVLGGLFSVWYFIAGPGVKLIDPWTRGGAYYALAMYDQAIDSYADALEASPFDDRAGEATYRVGRSLQANRRHAAAMAMYQQFLVEYPSHERAGEVRKQVRVYQVDGLR